MGKKRNRSTANAKPPNAGPDGVPTHASSFVEEVLESRDVEFAAEKKQETRIKRRKMTEQMEKDALKKAEKALKRASKKGGDNMAARKAGLEVWKRAAERRKLKGLKEDKQQELHEDDVVDPKTTARIFKEAREQRKEIQQENINDAAEEAARRSAKMDRSLDGVGERHLRKILGGKANDDSDSDEDSNSDVATIGRGMDEKELDFLDGTKVTEEDEFALAMFSNMELKDAKTNGADASPAAANGGGDGRIMLADLVLAKIREQEEAKAYAAEMKANPEKAARDRKIAEVYGLVGNILSRYRSGKVPKAFKVIPKFQNWEELLYLTRPDEWSPAAVYVGTRVLASNLVAREVVRFYEGVLLPRCMEDISDNKKLNYHLYRSLDKALYKPQAFIKGILFPLCEDPTVTMRQATIISSIVRKVSIPMLHSAAALMYIVQLPFSMSRMLIVKALIEKNYALPYKVVDSVVESFLRMKSDTRALPLLWHQGLLAFAQRYKKELTMEQKESLKALMKLHTHHAVTDEVRRELFSTRNRGDLMEPDADTIARNIESAAMIVG